MTDIKAVVFDIDGTLTKELSWVVLTERLGASVEEHLRIYNGYRSGRLSYERSKQELLALWQASGRARRSEMEKIFESIPLHKEAAEVINYLKSKGYNVCLITGSVDLYAEVVARKLGVTDYFANTDLVWDTDGNLVDYNYELEQARKKLEQFKGWSARHKLEPHQCAIVGDSMNDRELFTATGRGIAVKTEFEEPELESVAWKTINNLTELRTIL